MNFEKLLEEYSLKNFPLGLVGCRNSNVFHECCEYNLAVFDDKDEQDTIVEFENSIVCIKHCSLLAPRSADMVLYDNMKIISDESWNLHMLLSRIREKQHDLYHDCMRDSLVDSMFCVTKFRECAKRSDPFASCWIKCSALYLADAVLLSCMEKPSPSHALHKLRSVQKKTSGVAFSIVNDCIGAERATPSLLGRMTKSAAGFSDTVEGNGRSKIILEKAAYLESQSLLTDCYFYLQYVCRNILVGIKNDIEKKPDLFYILKISMDVESELTDLDGRANALYEQATSMLSRYD